MLAEVMACVFPASKDEGHNANLLAIGKYHDWQIGGDPAADRVGIRTSLLFMWPGIIV